MSMNLFWTPWFQMRSQFSIQSILPSSVLQPLLLVTVCAFPFASVAQEPTQQFVAMVVDEKTGEKADRKSARVEISPAEMAAAMEFARIHHPELFRLLEQLQKSRPDEFQKGIRDLHVQTQGITKLKERNPARYESQLEAWKLDSQIRVLVARWSRSKEPELKTQVRTLLAERQHLRMKHIEQEEKRLQEQLRKLQEQKNAMSAPLEERVQKEWDQLANKTFAAKKTREVTKQESSSTKP